MKSIIGVSILALILLGCTTKQFSTEEPLNLGYVIETGYGNTVDGDSMYWAIYEEWDNDGKRHLLYLNKATFDFLEKQVDIFNNVSIEKQDSLNHAHHLTLWRDNEGELHINNIAPLDNTLQK